MIDTKNKKIPITRQCELVGLSRSAFYYKPQKISDEDLRAARMIDEEFTRHPFFGSRRLTEYLQAQGFKIGRDKVRSLMRQMGLSAIYPKPRAKHIILKNKEHKVYSYLLGSMKITEPDHVWASDITYISLGRSHAYLTAVMDWYSRYVLSWELSLSMDSSFCVTALNDALTTATPEIFNTDQGSQYTSKNFTGVLKDAGIKISMAGKGRAFDNIMIERLWRSVKYEEVHLNEYANYFLALDRLRDYFKFYNEERRHSGIGGRTPQEVYFSGKGLAVA
jgi:putative transposase